MYKPYSCDSSGNKLAYIKNFYSLTKEGKVLEYSDFLSSYGELRFRIQTKDPVASQGVLNPYQNHIKLYRDNALVWAGVVISLPERNHTYIEVVAKTYAYLFTKVQVAHTSTTPDYREFKTGTMATAITTLFNEGKAVTSSPIVGYTLGTVDNPNYPWSTTAWTFTDAFSMRFEYANLFSVINSFADITNADWTVSMDKVFTFRTLIGRDRPDISFRYGKGGNVENYNSPLDGEKYVNDFIVASLDKSGAKIIKWNGTDTSTYATHGRLFGAALINENLDQNFLNEKGKAIFGLNKRLDSEVSVMLNSKALPMGVYDLGDTVKINISDGPIEVNQSCRIVGWRVSIDDVADEKITLWFNKMAY